MLTGRNYFLVGYQIIQATGSVFFYPWHASHRSVYFRHFLKQFQRVFLIKAEFLCIRAVF